MQLIFHGKSIKKNKKIKISNFNLMLLHICSIKALSQINIAIRKLVKITS